MKAIVHTRYGSPDVLEFTEVEKPLPKDDEVLVKVYAASVNALDRHGLHEAPAVIRLFTGGGAGKPKDPRIGVDLAGRVEAVGSAVTLFKPGDEVFGIGTGAFAEYACAHEGNLAIKPAGSSFEAAAAVPVAALTALQGLRDKGEIRPGEQVLIQGATGGVGSFAVQLAKALGAQTQSSITPKRMACELASGMM
jgi:NADPH:quinone reductase-like Zn-dependent oxidoreductase